MARLDPEECTFYGCLYEAARAGCTKGLCGLGCSREEAEEIFERVLLRVMDEVDPIDRDFDPPQMVNYLKRACRNQLIDDRRRQGGLDVTDLDRAGPVSDPRAMGLEEEAALHETMEEVRRALRSLPERERAVFCQRNLLGRSPDEIRRITGVSERTYRKLIERANAKVRAYLEQGEEN
ncbi:MAG TPA: sigma-70 family RNA polymerase sigma factor [Solirubrobacterales bacterium]